MHKNVRVLMVEDEPVTALLYTGWLKDAPLFNYHVQAVATVADAFRAIDADPFDVILLDLILPNGHGIEVLDRLILRLDERGKDIPVLVITGLDTSDLDVEALRCRATEFRLKRDLQTPTDLQRVLRYTFARHEASNVCAKLARDVQTSRQLTEQMNVLHETTRENAAGT